MLMFQPEQFLQLPDATGFYQLTIPANPKCHYCFFTRGFFQTFTTGKSKTQRGF